MLRGLTLAEAREAYSADELRFWAVWAEEFDLPDMYYATSQLGMTILGSFSGAKSERHHFAPIYKPQRASTEAEMLAQIRAMFPLANPSAL